MQQWSAKTIPYLKTNIAKIVTFFRYILYTLAAHTSKRPLQAEVKFNLMNFLFALSDPQYRVRVVPVTTWRMFETRVNASLVSVPTTIAMRQKKNLGREDVS